MIGAQNPVIWNVAIDFHHDAGCKRAGVLVDEGAENGALITDQIPEDTGMDDQWEEVLMRPAQGIPCGLSGSYPAAHRCGVHWYRDYCWHCNGLGQRFFA